MSNPATPSYVSYVPATHAPHAPRHEPVFQVRLMKHVGLAIAWYNRSYTVTGNYAQCQAAVTDAQHHNLAFGWWSIASVLLWNWIALATNASARKTLQRQAAQAFGHPSAFTGAPVRAPVLHMYS
jgi:hypothetical protein